MKKVYKIESVKISDGELFLKVDGSVYHFNLKKISKTLSKASEKELNNFQISPSGYGIHWPLLDEDLSISGLLKLAKE